MEFWSKILRNEEISPKDRLRASENLGKRYRLLEPEKDETSAKDALTRLCEAIKGAARDE